MYKSLQDLFITACVKGYHINFEHANKKIIGQDKLSGFKVMSRLEFNISMLHNPV